jgi:hypothetical protein
MTTNYFMIEIGEAASEIAVIHHMVSLREMFVCDSAALGFLALTAIAYLVV